MPKIRGVKPEFWTDEKTFDVDPAARLLFIGLWTFACDNGHVEDRPRQIKAKVFPADAIDVDALLDQLAEAELIVRGDGVVTVPNLGKHQRIDARYFTTCDVPGCEKPNRPVRDYNPSTRRAHDEHTSSTRRVHVEDSLGSRRGLDDDCDGDVEFEGEGDNKPSPAPLRSAAADAAADSLGTITLIPTPPAARAKAGADEANTKSFEQWWANAWPGRKVAKKEARKAWDAAVKKASVEDITLGAENYGRWIARTGTPLEKTKHPSSWLNAERWEDDLTPPRAAAAQRIPEAW